MRVGIHADLVPDAGQGLGVIFLLEAIIPLPVEQFPKLVLAVICIGVEPLHAPQFTNLVFQLAILGDELVGLGRSETL